MTSFKKLSLLLTLGLVSIASNKALAAPAIAVELETSTAHGSNFKSEFSAVKNPETTRRQLAELLGPALAAVGPLSQGVDQGATEGATNVNAALRASGAAVHQATQGAGDATQGITQGAGETVAEVPGATDRTIHNLEKAGIAGDVLTTLTGASADD